MFDYISCTIINPQIAKSLLTDSRFSFKSIYNHKTKQWEDGNIAVFHQMKIYVYSNGRIIFKGSLHKLYNGIYTNCAWNHDQFDFSKVSIAVDFFRDLNLDPSELKLSNYEVGHNLHLNISCKDFLNSLICYKSKSFHEMRAANLYCINGKDCYLDEYAVKIYDKGLQYNFNIDNLLRIEKKIRKIRNSGRQFLTLADVLDKSFWKECQNQLIDIIEDFIIVEPTDQNLIEENLLFYNTCTSNKLWSELNKVQRYDRKLKLEKFNRKFGIHQLKEKTKQLCNESFDRLINNCPNNINLEKQTFNYTFKSTNLYEYRNLTF